MAEEISIREYEQAVYVYWFGPSLPTVKIGHSNDPDKRLMQLGNDTGVPDHLASFAAIVWVDRKREKVEALAHKLAVDYWRTGEWFELSASSALEYILESVRQLGVRYEVEDRAGVYNQPPENFQEAAKFFENAKAKFAKAKVALADTEKKLAELENDADEAIRTKHTEQVKYSRSALGIALLEKNRAKGFYDEKFEIHRLTPEYFQEQQLEISRKRKLAEDQRINEIKFNEKAIAFWKTKWDNEKK